VVRLLSLTGSNPFFHIPPESRMKTTSHFARGLCHAGVLIIPLLLAACGGGGGGGAETATASTTPQPLALTATNAKSASADALDNALTTTSSSSAMVVNLLKSQVVAAPGNLPGLQRTATALARLVPASGRAKAAISETMDCPLGGTLAAVGSIANPSGLFAGDALSLTAVNCTMSIDGSTVTLSGAISLSVNSGSVGDSYPFHVDMSFTAGNFRTQVGQDSLTVTGDEHLVWTASSPSEQTLQSSGASYSTTTVFDGKTRSSVWRNYQQTITLADAQVASTLSAQVETVNARLGSQPVTYQITTPQALVASGITGDIISGAVLVTGKQSALLITFTGANSVELKVDANGDGAYESTLTSTMSELAGLL